MLKRYKAGILTDMEEGRQSRTLFGNLAKSTKRMISRDLLVMAVLLIALPSSGEQRTVNFEEALLLADSLNPDIRSARSRITELHHKKRQITASLLPQIDASASYTRLGETPPGKKYLLGESQNDIYTDISARQTLFDGGRYRYQRASVDKQITLETRKLDQNLRNIRTAVTRAWLEAMRSRYGIVIQRDFITRLQEQQAIAELLYSSGKVSNLDVLRIKTQILSAQGQLRSLDAVLANKLHLLAQAIGTSELLAIPEKDDELIEQLPSLSGIVCGEKDAIGMSPEVNAAIAAYEKSIVDQRVLRAEYLPTLSARGGYNLEDNTIIPQNPNWNAGVVLNVPIFRGGSVRAQVAQAQERTFQASQAIENAKISFAARLRSALETSTEKYEKIAIAEQTWEAAKETGDAADLRYSSGKLSAFELIDAQNVLSRTRQDVINARIDYRIALEELVTLCSSETTNEGAE
jgi:outer membrane protein